MNTVNENKLTRELNQPSYTKQGFGGKITLKRLLLIPFKLIILAIGLFLFCILRVFYPILQIRIGELRGFNRIGELSCRVGFYLRCCEAGELQQGKRDIFLSGEPANDQFFKISQRYLNIIRSSLFLMMYRLVRKTVGESVVWVDMPDFVNYHRIFNTTEAPVSFQPEEEEKGRKLLLHMGVKEGRPFVCIHARDSVYLDKVHKYHSREEWAYHDYRDCDIDNFMSAAEYLVSQGMYVIRMGFHVEKELKTDNPYIIDYASKFRNDFGDVYLSAKCKFFVGSEGGLSCIPWAFNVPVVYTNGAPMGSVAGWRSTDVFLPKKFWSNTQEKFLSFHESINMGNGKWFRGDQYSSVGIKMIENTPEEILGAVTEMNKRIDGNWVTSEDESSLQESYRGNFTDTHIVYGYPSRVSDAFLRSNMNLLMGSVVKNECA